MGCDGATCPYLRALQEHQDKQFEKVLKELRRLKQPTESERTDFITEYLLEHGYICYGLISSTEEGALLFKDSETFQRSARLLVPVLYLKSELIEHDRYYWVPDFDIQKVRDHAKARRFKPDDPKLMEQLGRLVLECGQLDLRNHLRREYPAKGEPWIDEVLDALSHSSYRVERHRDNQDVFRKPGHTDHPVIPPSDPTKVEMDRLVRKVQATVRTYGNLDLRNASTLLGHEGDEGWLARFRDYLEEVVKNSPNYARHIHVEPGDYVVRLVAP